jgi:Ca2+-transporting ATPase
MSTIYSGISLPNKSCFVLCKGAPEAVIKSCKSYLASSKAIAKDYNTLNFIEECPELPLDDVFLEYISKKSVEMASKGLRVLALAIKRVTLDVAEQITRSNDQNSAESDLLLVGLIGLIDPPKPGVKESVRTCKDMGIQVVMITGLFIFY